MIRWEEEEKEKAESSDTNVSSDANVKQEPAKINASPINVSPQKNDRDENEDELAPSRWWGLGIRTAAIAAAVLILAGGYFVAKPLLLNTPSEIAGTEAEEQTDDEQVAATVPDGGSAIADPNAYDHRQLPGSPLPASVVPTPNVSVASIASPVFAQGASPPEPASPPVSPFGSFSAPVAPPPIAEEAAPVVANPFGGMPIAAEQVASAFSGTGSPTADSSAEDHTQLPGGLLMPTTTESEPAHALTVLQPLAPIPSAQSAAVQPHLQPHLQPLVALGATTFSPSPAIAVPATPSTMVASDYSTPVARSTPPAVDALPQTPVQPTFAIVEPMREIIPQIPASGTVQEIPPPIIPPAPEIPPVPSVTMHPNESAPAIPRDVSPAIAAMPPVVAVSAAAMGAVESAPRILPADSLPLDWQLMERLGELHNEAEAPPSNLRFDNVSATSEPALRFSPIQLATPAEDAAIHFAGLMPTGVPRPNELHPNSGDIESFLPTLENLPPPVVAVPAPAYRDISTQTHQSTGESGMTFRSRINSEITRTPSATETYIVRQGDTYMTISDQFYGTSLLYTALARHNQRLGIGWQPAAGAVIEIPTAEFLRMHYGETAHQGERRLDAPRQTVRYIVQEGDTIFRLATDRLRDSTRWREIYAMNADRIHNVHELQAGMEILLPIEAARLN